MKGVGSEEEGRKDKSGENEGKEVRGKGGEERRDDKRGKKGKGMAETRISKGRGGQE